MELRLKSLNKLAIYSCEDADFTERLTKPLNKKLETEKLTNLFKTIEMPLASSIGRISAFFLLVHWRLTLSFPIK